MRTFLTGGTGFVGKTVASILLDQGHEVTVLTRSAPSGPPSSSALEYEVGDPRVAGAWQEKVAAHDAVINLAGASIFCRWTRANKRLIRESRVETTRNVVDALAARRGKETILISASGAGYYGFREEEGLGEDASPGNDFLAMLSQDWETEALRAEQIGVRVVLCRLGVVLGKEGGALKKMAPAFRAGLGSPLAKGEQWFSWIHEKDLAGILLFLLNREDVAGPVNCTAPQPIRNREMTKTLGQALRRPTFLPPVPGTLLKLALGEFAQVFSEGQCVVPARLLHLGFTFRFPTLAKALEDLLGAEQTRS
jgi:uncharacterized protein (TIGR01777 family)